jgi:hypothetical protein
MRLWQMRDDKVDFAYDFWTQGLLSKILFAIFVPLLTMPGVEVTTKLDVAHHRIRHQITSSHCWTLCLRLHK